MTQKLLIFSCSRLEGQIEGILVRQSSNSDNPAIRADIDHRSAGACMGLERLGYQVVVPFQALASWPPPFSGAYLEFRVHFSLSSIVNR